MNRNIFLQAVEKFCIWTFFSAIIPAMKPIRVSGSLLPGFRVAFHRMSDVGGWMSCRSEARRRLLYIFPLGLLAAAALFCAPAGAAPVEVREETITLPTYLVGEPEPNPMFYFGRRSQGAEGRIYPYPLNDSLTNVKSNKTYRIVYLENEYIRVGVLPEIGGRLFEAVDKSNDYDFVYRQHVIKPALIGLTGAWISGGIEWSIPHHHRASTFLPVQYRVEDSPDGGRTVWVGELELRHRMRWAVGYTLEPGKSYLTARVRIFNRTPVANTMLCFANVAVHVNDQYQVIFPPGTQFVSCHAKREFATWPVAKGRYAGADFGNGTDVSWYSNHLHATSMFAWNCTDDFFAGYDHSKQAGTMCVADHHTVPGKKFWTWGNGPRGRMWEKILTDNDGPYIELMAGAYSDNQPDYSWLQPFETKAFEVNWYPFRGIGGVKNANLDAAVNLEITPNGTAKLGFCTTAAQPSATVSLKAGDLVLLEEQTAIDPATPFVKEVPIPAGTSEESLRASLLAAGRELVAYSPVRLRPASMPKAVEAPPKAEDIKNAEELYLAGLRIEQFYDPDWEPELYWGEALRRDPGDARVNTAFGIRKLKQARYAEAEAHFRKALARLTANCASPKDGEPYYYLGVALKAQGKTGDAFDAFQNAAWSDAWRGASCFSLAEIAAGRGNFPAALDFLERSLAANALNLRALTLKAAVLRHSGRTNDALAVLHDAAGRTDPLDVRLKAERWLAGGQVNAFDVLGTVSQFPETALETAAEYANAGLWRDGTALLEAMVNSSAERLREPLVYYYLGQFVGRLGVAVKASEYCRLAAEIPPDRVFPFQPEAVTALRFAMDVNRLDARAPYYLGNLLYDWQPEEAVKLWEQSAALDPSFAIVHRNLAMAYAQRKTTNDLAKAIERLEQAVALPVKYALHFTELDELYAEAGSPPERRLALLELVLTRDDALSRAIGLKVFAGKYDEAIQLMKDRRFSVWEGGRLGVAEHWANAHLLRGQKRFAARDFLGAIADFTEAGNLPDNLPSDRGAARAHETEIAYRIGLAHEAMGDAGQARRTWQQAVAARDESRERRRADDSLVSSRSVELYYRALAHRKLGQTAEADALLGTLLADAEAQLKRKTEPVDSSSEPSAERLSPQARKALAYYVAGLAHLGLWDTDKALAQFRLALQTSPDHLGAKVAIEQLR
jgi:tetratricopeptide (TPR) repeat protein